MAPARRGRGICLIPRFAGGVVGGGCRVYPVANERGALCVDAIFHRITIQNPVKLVYCCIAPHIRLVFYVKNQALFLARVQHFTNLSNTYCQVEKNGTRDVAARRTQPDHRKSKFRLRHAIRLN